MADDLKQSVKSATSVAKETVDSAAGQVQNATDQVSKVGRNMQRAVDKSISDQPYATLVMAAGVGFVLGALWKS